MKDTSELDQILFSIWNISNLLKIMYIISIKTYKLNIKFRIENME